MANLTKANLRTSFDGHLWIDTNRQKTGIETNIWLLDVAKHIIEKYDSMAERNKLLPVPCYVNCKNSIKAIAKKCGIEKPVSFHLSRHSFAVMALNYGMPIESVSKILGHTDIKTTQIYAKVTNTKLNSDISAFENKISGRFDI